MIPAYNAANYLREAVDSVINQPCDDLEVLILDDGSTDETLAIAQAYAEEDERVRVITHENMGLGRNRNHGMRYVRGRCLLFLDHDDAVLPGFFTERMKGFVSDCFQKGIEVIVPARLLADEPLANAVYCPVPYDGVYAGSSEVCWRIDHEFATLLYSVAMLRRNELLFSETRPEVESIFRHKAVFCAEKALFTNRLWFAIRRDNPDQITKNWDMDHVNEVREQEYRRLLAWHAARGTEGEVMEEARRRHEETKAVLSSSHGQEGRRPGGDTEEVPLVPGALRPSQDGGAMGQGVEAPTCEGPTLQDGPMDRCSRDDPKSPWRAICSKARSIGEGLRKRWRAPFRKRESGHDEMASCDITDGAWHPLGEYVLNEAQQERVLETVAKM